MRKIELTGRLAADVERKISKTGKEFLYFRVGTESAKVAEKLQQNGFLAYSLAGGYMGWLQKHINDTLTQDKQLRDRVAEHIAKHTELLGFSNGVSALEERVEEGIKNEGQAN